MIQQSKMDRIKELVALLNKAGKSYYSEGAAIQSFFSGMILQTISQKNRQDFEMELQHINDSKEEKMEK